MPSSEYKIEAILAKEGMVRAAAEVDKALAGIDKRIDEIGKSGDDIRRKTSGPGGFLGISDRDLKNIESKLRDVSQGLSTVGTGLTAFGAAVTGGLAIAAQRAISFETAFAGVRKTVDASEAEFAQLRDRFTELSEEIPVSASELARIGETAGQLGIRGVGNITDFTKTIADLGVASNVTGQEGATMLARFANVTGDERYRQLANVIVDLGNNSATTEAEILEMAQRLASAGTTAGLSSDQILGMAAALSSVGIRAEAGGTAFSKLTIEIAGAVANGGSKLQEFADVAGVSVERFAQQFRENGAQAIALFTAGLGRIDEAGGNVFAILDQMGLSEIRLRNAILATSNAQDLFTATLDRSAKAITNTNALNQEAERFYATTENQLRVLVNTLDNMAREIGSVLLPTIVSFAQAARDVVIPIRSWLAENPALVKGLVQIAGILGGGSLVAGGLILLVSKLASSIANVIPILKQFQTASVTAAGSQGVGSLVTALRTAATAGGAIGLFGAAFAAMIAVTLKNLDDLRDKFKDTFGELIDPEVIESAASLRDALKQLNVNVTPLAGETIPEYVARLKQAAAEHRILRGEVESIGGEFKKTTIFVEGVGDVVFRTGGHFKTFSTEAADLGIRIDKIGEVSKEAGGNIKLLGGNTEETNKKLEAFAKIQETVNETLSVFRGAADAARISREESARIEAQNAAALSEVEGKMQAVNQRLKELAAASRESEREISDFNRALFETVTAQTQLGSTMGTAGRAGIEALGTAAIFARDEYGRLTGATVEVAQATTNARDPIQQISTAITDLGKEIADFVIEGGRLIDVFAEFGKTLLRILTENLLGRLIGQLGQLIGMIPGLKGLGGIFSGGGGGLGGAATGVAGRGLNFGGLAGALGIQAAGFGGGLAELFGIGVEPIAGLGAQTSLGTILGSGGAGLAGLGLAGLGLARGGKSGFALATGGGALAGFSFGGPIGAAIGAAAGAITATFRSIGKSAAEKFSEEFARDFGNVRVPEDTVKKFVSNLGITEKALEPIRKDIASSPLFLGLGAHLAELQGRTEGFLSSLENVGNVFGSADFRSSFEFGQITGDFSFLNEKFVELFGNSTELVRVFGQDLKPLLIDMGNEFEPLADRITRMTDAGANLETVFAKFAPEIILFLDAAEKTGQVLPPAIQQFEEMAIATDGLRQFQLDLLAQLQTTREFFPVALADMADNINLLKDAGASTDEVIFLLKDDIEFLIRAAEQLGIEIPPVVQDMYDLANATEEVEEEMSAAAKTGKIWADTLGLVGDAAVDFTSGFESVFTSAENAARQVTSLTGEFAGLVTLMEGNGLDTLTAQERAWGILAGRILDAYNDTLLFGGEIDPLLQKLIDLGIEFGLIQIGVDGYAQSIDRATQSMRVINGEWVALSENIANAVTEWGLVDDEFRTLLGFGDPAGTTRRGPVIDVSHPLFPFSGAPLPPGLTRLPDGTIVREEASTGSRSRGASFPVDQPTGPFAPTTFLIPTPAGLGDLQNEASSARRIPSFAVGGVMARDGLAFLHAGERVTPAGRSSAITVSAPVQVNVRVSGSVDNSSAQSIGREVDRALTVGFIPKIKRALSNNEDGLADEVNRSINR